MTDRRFLVEPEDLDVALAGGDPPIAVLRAEEHHHLSRVLRLKRSEEVAVFDGEGRGWLGVIESVGKDESLVRLTRRDDRRVEPDFRTVLAQGLPHHDRMDWIVQKTTELGVKEIVPILSRRSVPRPGRDGGSRRPRWIRVARDAARQSGRLVVPRIAEPVGWEDYLAQRAPQEEAAARVVLSPDAADSHPLEPLLRGAARGAAVLAVGPEGGWSGPELELARAAGFEGIRLGPRVMRAETAGVVAVALALFLAGEMGPCSHGGRLP